MHFSAPFLPISTLPAAVWKDSRLSPFSKTAGFLHECCDGNHSELLTVLWTYFWLLTCCEIYDSADSPEKKVNRFLNHRLHRVLCKVLGIECTNHLRTLPPRIGPFS